MAGPSPFLAVLVTSTFFTVAAEEQAAEQKKALRENVAAPQDDLIDTPSAMGAPTHVKLLATCQPSIKAFWEYSAGDAEGFEVTLRDQDSHPSQRFLVPAAQRDAVFPIALYPQNFTFAIRSYRYGEDRTHWSEEVEETVTFWGQAPKVEGFKVHVRTATSARITWKKNCSKEIHISACPSAHPEHCRHYTTDGNLLEYVIFGLKPATAYIVHAWFDGSLDGRVCRGLVSSQRVDTPPQAPPSLQARVISITGNTVTLVVHQFLTEQEFVQVTVNGENRPFHERIFTLRGLVPGQKYMLELAACVSETNCSIRTELEVVTPEALPSPRIEIVEVRDSSITIRWTFPEEVNQSTASYRVGYRSVRGSLADVTSDLFYQFTSLEPNSTYIVYVEALSTEDGGASIIGSPSFATVTTKTERPQRTGATVNPAVPALSTEEGRAQPVAQSFATSSERLGTSQRPSTSHTLEVTETSTNPMVAALSTGVRDQPVLLIFITPSTKLGRSQERGSGRPRSAFPILIVLSVLMALLCGVASYMRHRD